MIPQFVAFEQEPQIPEIEKYLEWMEKIGKEPVEIATIGWILADQFVTGLKLAGPEFSQQKVIDGAEHAHRLQRQRHDPADRLDQAARGPGGESGAHAARSSARTSRRSKDGKFVAQWGETGQAVGLLRGRRADDARRAASTCRSYPRKSSEN